MFQFAQDGRVRWPVTLDQVQEDGSIAAQEFGVVYRRLTRDELKARRAKLMAVQKAIADLHAQEGDHRAEIQQAYDAQLADDDASLRDRVLDWYGIADADQQPIAFSTTVLDAFLQDELLRNALLIGLLEASEGVRAKNSSPGLAGWPAATQG